MGLGIFILALILFLIPPKSEDKQRQNELEDSISKWSYTRKNNIFKGAKFSLKFLNKNLSLNRFILDKVEVYEYRIDHYYPTYDELFHVYDREEGVKK